MKLDAIAPWGRTLEEYKLMFNLSEADLQRQILGCGDGPASFNAQMTELGYSVTSVDPVYQFSAAQIEERVQASYEPIISQVKQNAERYVWKNFRDADELGEARLSAMKTFLADYDSGKAEGRYQFQSLPTLDVADNAYELCFCSHLLFTYSEKLSCNFHMASIRELLRIAAEVRIFPLLALDGKTSPHLDAVMKALKGEDFEMDIQTVNYEFQKGGNQMLKIGRENS
ncbi:MAG: SAM-dependent methyltransferase [Cyanobacteria bacterium J06648_10]